MTHEAISEPGRFGPLADGDPLVGMECPLCTALLAVGDRPALVDPFPADPDEFERASAGEAHTAVAKVAHERCAHP